MPAIRGELLIADLIFIILTYFLSIASFRSAFIHLGFAERPYLKQASVYVARGIVLGLVAAYAAQLRLGDRTLQWLQGGLVLASASLAIYAVYLLTIEPRT